ncbi:MAG: hypothetical protein LQ340_005743 [Diploschistes diacapsis]|nr:MAG: hypothetical protein LQ340_005743 [Diploschistes diacapsis]
MSGKPGPVTPNDPLSSPPRLIPSTTDPLPTPPPSPRKRRQLLRSSEETDTILNLDEYLTIVDGYRFTSPILDPLPIETSILPQSHPLSSQQDRIYEIARNGLNATAVRGTCALWLYHSVVHGPAEPKPLVSISTWDEPTPSWRHAVTSIKKTLKNNGFGDIAVQLYHQDKAHQLRRYPISKSDGGEAIAAGWQRSQDAIAALLSKRLERPCATWSYASIFLCGRIGGKLVPTLVIKIDGTSYRSAQANWKQLELELKDLLRRYGGTNIEVEFAYGKLHTQILEPTIPIRAETMPGDSIGIAGDSIHSGTLGGFVGLYKPDWKEPRLCAVTCHHVVRPEERSSDAFANVLDLQPTCSEDARASIMRSPSAFDYDSVMGELGKALRLHVTRIGELEAEKQRQDGFLVPFSQRTLDSTLQRKSDVEKQIEIFKPRSGIFGRTIACSGFRLNNKESKMDWALVETTSPEKFAANYPPQAYEIGRHMPESYNPDPISTKMGKMERFDWVVLRGRTSGISPGMVNACNTVVDKWRTRDLKMSRETVVMGSLDLGAELKLFGRGGDSGAFVYNADGLMVGMQIAGDKELSVVTQMVDLVDDIESVTGAKVFFPTSDVRGLQQKLEWVAAKP